MATKLNDFSLLAQAVWAEPHIGGKTELVIGMIDACMSSKEKKLALKRDLSKMNTLQRIDKFAADMMLRDTDKRIR
jgi:hypothetical protein